MDSVARTGDVRALAFALALGSISGLAVGGAYVAGAVARVAASPQPAPSTVLPAPGTPRPSPVVAALGARLRTSLRLAPPAELPAVEARVVDRRQGVRCLAQAVYYEARGESPTGQAAVAQVVMNRVRHPAFPKTVCSVVYEKHGDACQFTFACDGAMREAVDADAWMRAQTVARRALGGAVLAPIGQATLFQAVRADAPAPLSVGLLKVARIGAHVFYRLAKRGAVAAEPARTDPDAAPPVPAPVQRVQAAFSTADAGAAGVASTGEAASS